MKRYELFMDRDDFELLKSNQDDSVLQGPGMEGVKEGNTIFIKCKENPREYITRVINHIERRKSNKCNVLHLKSNLEESTNGKKST